jgi:MFS family permease
MSMTGPLSNARYRRLFGAQVVALVGTGLATLALSLLAYDLAGESAGAVLGTALAIKMITYVGFAPFAGQVASRVPRRAMLVSLDVLRAGVAVSLPFVDSITQIYALIFVLQACSALFTPTFQATIPELLPDREQYTRALSLSRLAYDLESVLSPLLATVLLLVLDFRELFVGTALGFMGSALLVLTVALPPELAPAERPSGGLRRFLATPRLRGLLAFELAAAAAGAVVYVNGVVYVRDELDLGDGEVALALAVFGAGSMLVAILLPRLLEHSSDRLIMAAGAALLLLGMLAGVLHPGFAGLLAAWAMIGAGSSAIHVPAGRLLQRSSDSAGRPGIFAAHFALSHACWLICYPLAGRSGVWLGLEASFAIAAALVVLGLLLALVLWPANDPDVIEHTHGALPSDHPHRVAHEGVPHAHAFLIDDLHPHWPRSKP